MLSKWSLYYKMTLFPLCLPFWQCFPSHKSPIFFYTWSLTEELIGPSSRDQKHKKTILGSENLCNKMKIQI